MRPSRLQAVAAALLPNAGEKPEVATLRLWAVQISSQKRRRHLREEHWRTEERASCGGRTNFSVDSLEKSGWGVRLAILRGLVRALVWVSLRLLRLGPAEVVGTLTGKAEAECARVGEHAAFFEAVRRVEALHILSGRL